MATSGVTTYQQTANELINAAYRKTGIMAKGQTADAEELAHGITALNSVIALLRTRGMQLWKVVERTIPLVADQADYILTQPNKPFKILQAWVTPGNSGTRIPVEQESTFDINRLPTTSSGVPVKFAYVPGNTTGTMTIWPKPSAAVVSNYTFQIIEQREFDIVTAGTETLDFPSEWTLPLTYGVAMELSKELSIPITDRQEIKKDFNDYITAVESGGGEDASLYVQPRKDY